MATQTCNKVVPVVFEHPVPATARSSRRLRRTPGVWGWLRRVGLVAVTVVALEYVAVRLLPDARASWESIGAATPVLLVLALALQAGSLASYSRLTLALLPASLEPGLRPPYRVVLAVDLTGYGVSHVVPGGGAAAAALRFRLFARLGLRPSDTVSMAMMEYAVNVLWLVAAFLLGLVAAIPHPETHAFLRTASVLVLVLLTTFGGLVAVLVVRPDQVARATHLIAGRLPLLRPSTVEHFLRGVVVQVQLVLRDPARSRRAGLDGLAYWVLDAGCLYLSVLAFGFAPNPGGLLATYALVSLIALLPVTPGGLGLVEGVAVPLLVSFGTPDGPALLGVLTWRLFGFWLPIPVALVAYLWLRVRAPWVGVPADATE